MNQQQKLEALFDRMVGQTIDEVWIEDDEFVIMLTDNTKVILFSDEDLQLYYEYGDAAH
jgi:hypothetical protein